MRTRYLIVSAAVAVLIAVVLGIGYAMLRGDLRARQDRTARYCNDVIRAMEFYGEALAMAGPAENRRQRLDSPERNLASMTLSDGYYHCLVEAGVDHPEASKLSLRLGLGMNATSVEDARQALNQAMERLRGLGY